MPRWAEQQINRHGNRHQGGFSLLELVIVIVLVVVLFLAAFDRLLPLRGDAESAHVATVVGGLRSAIGLEAAARVTREGLPALAGLEGTNPMALLQEWPERYLGSVNSRNLAEVTPGAWYFDEQAGELGYRVRFPQYLEAAPEGRVDLRWRIQLQYEDLDDNGRFDAGSDRVRGLRLTPLDGHRWPGQPRHRILPP